MFKKHCLETANLIIKILKNTFFHIFRNAQKNTRLFKKIFINVTQYLIVKKCVVLYQRDLFLRIISV